MMTTLTIYAAGSLRYVLPVLITQFTQRYSLTITPLFAPAGLLCEKIIQQANQPVAHLFASANTAHPQTLIQQGLATEQTVFTHNRLCMVMRKQHTDTSLDWLRILCDSNNRIGMSTPNNDPSGDYTFALFDAIESHHPTVGNRLKHTALQLVGNQLSSPLPTGCHPAEYFLLQNQVDIFIGYANYAAQLQQNTQLTIIDIPVDYYPPIDYGIALLTHPHPYAQVFIDYILSQEGQQTFKKHGFMSN